ncbi:MAG: T9SS type A sorting domain-containing protein [Calditrichaceae bacterium]
MFKVYRYSIFLVFIMLFLLNPGKSWSQIVIDQSEYDITFGKSFNQYFVGSTDVPIPVNVGTTGGPQTWTFTLNDFPNGETYTTTIVNPSTTPFAQEFQSSDHAWFSVFDTFSVYFYLDLTSTELLGLGSGTSDPDTTYIQKYIPYDKILQFPLSMGTTWNSNYADTFSSPDMFEIIDSTSSTSTVDAWGTINVPAGTFDCLRIRTEDTDFTFFISDGVIVFSDTSRYISYFWITENEGLLADVSSTEGETNPNFTEADDVSMRVTDPTSVTEPEPSIIHSYNLMQNYPNPFNPATAIRFELSAAGTVSLKVYDLLGKEVRTLVNGWIASGAHEVLFDGSNLASGVYFYRLETKDYSQMRKMLLVR